MEGHSASGMAVPVVFPCTLVLLTFIVPGVMLVMSVEHLVFFDMGFRDTSTLDVYDLVLLILATPALGWLWTAARRPRAARENTFLKPCNSGHGLLALICLLAFLSLIYPVFNVVAIASCFEADVSASEVLRVCLNMFKLTFVILQTLFFVSNMKDYQCRTKLTMTSVMVLVSTNACLCIRCLSDAVRQTMINNKSHNMTQAWGSAFCKTQSLAITEGYRIVDKYFYTFILFYCLYSMEVLCTMWNVLGSPTPTNQGSVQANLESINYEQESIRRAGTQNERTPLLRSHSSTTTWTKVKSIYVVGICRYSFITATVVCLLLAVAHTVLDIEMREFDPPKNDTRLNADTAFVWIQTLYENFMTGAAFVGLLFVIKEPFDWSKLFSKHTMLVVATCAFAVLIALEPVDAIGNMIKRPRAEDICLFLFRTVFHFLGMLFQTPFVIKSSYIPNVQHYTNKYVYIRGILWFLAIANLERSLVDTFLTPIILRYASNVSSIDYFGIDNWAIVTRVVFPMTAFYRLQTSLLCFENARNMSQQNHQPMENTAQA